MSAMKILAIVLIVAGIAGLMYGKFSYTKQTHEAKLGSLELSVKEKETVVPPRTTPWRLACSMAKQQRTYTQ